MRVFRDVEMVEALGSGMMRILSVYNRSNFIFLNNFIRVVIPFAWIPQEQKTVEKTVEKIVSLMKENPSITISELATKVNLSRHELPKSL